MTGSKINRRAGAAHTKDKTRGSGGDRDLVPAAPGIVNKSLTHSRLTETLVLAHRFASRFQEPQPHGTRRGEPAGNDVDYRKVAKRPARRPRALTKKI